MKFRQVHIDFHTSEAIEGIGKKFDKKQFQDALKVGHVDSITVFAKCHHGWSYYPSKINPMHPNLNFDLLGAQLEAAKEIGVSAKVYVSAGLDEKTAREHPEWLVRKIDESTLWASNFSKPGYHKLCMNSPYLDVLCAQVKEVCEKYKSDAIFLDITTIQPCYCQNCIRILRTEGKNPYDENNIMELAERTYAKYTSRIRETIDSVDKSVGVFHNGGHVSRGRLDIAFMDSHLELEALPTGGWGYDYFPQSARFFINHDIEYLGMTGKFHKAWGEFGGFKHPNALRYEVSLNAALGAKCSIGDQLHPDGEMDMATYKLIGAAYSELEAKEPWLDRVNSVTDIGVLSNEAVGSSMDADTGVLRILQEGHYLFDFIDENSDLSKYKVVVLPETKRLSNETAEKIKAFCSRGGKILAVGEAPLYEDEDKMAFDLGADWIGVQNEYSVSYFRPNNKSTRLEDTGYLLYCDTFKVAPLNDCAMTVRMERPYFERTAEHFCSHLHAPNSGEYLGAGVTKGTDGMYIAANVFTEYVTMGSLIAKYLVFDALDALLEGRKTIAVTLPSQGKVTLMEQKEENRYICHLLYASPILRGKNTEVIEDIVPLYNVLLTLRVPKNVKSVYLAPTKEKIDFRQTDNEVELCVPKIDCHTMVVFEFF